MPLVQFVVSCHKAGAIRLKKCRVHNLNPAVRARTLDVDLHKRFLNYLFVAGHAYLW